MLDIATLWRFFAIFAKVAISPNHHSPRGLAIFSTGFGLSAPAEADEDKYRKFVARWNRALAIIVLRKIKP